MIASKLRILYAPRFEILMTPPDKSEGDILFSLVILIKSLRPLFIEDRSLELIFFNLQGDFVII